MFPLEVYQTFMIIDMLMFLYMFIDIKNRVYGNVISGIIASFISAYLAIISVSGTITTGIRAEAFDTSVADLTTVLYRDADLMQDEGLMWFWIGICAIQSAIAVLFIVEAWYEKNKKGSSPREG